MDVTKSLCILAQVSSVETARIAKKMLKITLGRNRDIKKAS